MASSVGKTESRWSRRNQDVEVKPDNVDNGLKTAFIVEKTEENPSSSETRPKEGGAALSLYYFIFVLDIYNNGRPSYHL